MSRIKVQAGKRYRIADYRGEALPKDFTVTPVRKVFGPVTYWECRTSRGGTLHVRPSEFIAEARP